MMSLSAISESSTSLKLAVRLPVSCASSFRLVMMTVPLVKL